MSREPSAVETLVLGLDIGGTSSRATVVDLTGTVRGTGVAGGGNPNSHPPEHAAEQVALAARSALAAVRVDQVSAAVLGMAGVSRMADPEVARLFGQVWADIGLRREPRVVSDCEVAFASGTPAGDGVVLIGGTGAIGAVIRGHRLLRTVGGHGWLLGDEGSAFWFGREAARAALRTLDRGASDTVLVAVCEHVLAEAAPAITDHAVARDLRRRLISAINAERPVRLAELAPCVTTAALAGDPLAEEIVRRGAGLLADTAQACWPDGSAPIVLAGALLADGNPVGAALRAELHARGWTLLHSAGSGAAGAAWLAAADCGGVRGAVPLAELHAAFVRPDDT